VDSVRQGRFEQSGVVEEGSVTDLLAHMCFGAAKAAQDLKALGSGGEDEIETPGGDEMVAQWNAREATARHEMSLGELRDEWEKGFTNARTAFEAVPAEKLEIGWPQLSRFLGDTTIHYREHEHHIRTWLKQLETTEG